MKQQWCLFSNQTRQKQKKPKQNVTLLTGPRSLKPLVPQVRVRRLFSSLLRRGAKGRCVKRRGAPITLKQFFLGDECILTKSK